MATTVPKVNLAHNPGEGEAEYNERLEQDAEKYYQAYKVNYHPRDGEKADAYNSRIEREQQAFDAAYDIYRQDFSEEDDETRFKKAVAAHDINLGRDRARELVSVAMRRRYDESKNPSGVPGVLDGIWKRSNVGTNLAKMINELDANNYDKGLQSALDKGPCAETIEHLKWISWKTAYRNHSPFDVDLGRSYDAVAQALRTYWTFLVELNVSLKKLRVAGSVGHIYEPIISKHRSEWFEFYKWLRDQIVLRFTKNGKLDSRVDDLQRWNNQTLLYMDEILTSCKV